MASFTAATISPTWDRFLDVYAWTSPDELENTTWYLVEVAFNQKKPPAIIAIASNSDMNWSAMPEDEIEESTTITVHTPKNIRNTAHPTCPIAGVSAIFTEVIFLNAYVVPRQITLALVTDTSTSE
jgi:hypothetical protein